MTFPRPYLINRRHHVSTEAFDAALKLQLLLKPLSYKVSDLMRV